MLYYTFTKRWFTDAMNFADLPSLNEADTKVEGQFLPGKYLPKNSPKKVPPNSPLSIAQCVFYFAFSNFVINILRENLDAICDTV